MAESARADVWTSSVRLYKSRAIASKACTAGHVSVNGTNVKPSQHVFVGDKIEALTPGGLRIVEVSRIILKRVGAPVASSCYLDRTPPPPPKSEIPMMPRRDPGAGRPTKRDRRAIDKLRGH